MITALVVRTIVECMESRNEAWVEKSGACGSIAGVPAKYHVEYTTPRQMSLRMISWISKFRWCIKASYNTITISISCKGRYIRWLSRISIEHRTYRTVLVHSSINLPTKTVPRSATPPYMYLVTLNRWSGTILFPDSAQRGSD